MYMRLYGMNVLQKIVEAARKLCCIVWQRVPVKTMVVVNHLHNHQNSQIKQVSSPFSSPLTLMFIFLARTCHMCEYGT